MNLKWEKIGKGTWLGFAGWLRYHIDCCAPVGRRGHREYLLAKGGIMSADWQGSYRTLSEAKAAAQKEAIDRVNAIASGASAS